MFTVLPVATICWIVAVGPAGLLGRREQGRQIDVFYDPADPQKVELA